MTDQHPITPPSELVEQWENETAHTTKDEIWHVAVQAARWGADQELEACCEYMQHEDFHGFATELRAARRPKPPSLKEQALTILDDPYRGGFCENEIATIRRALEALPND